MVFAVSNVSSHGSENTCQLSPCDGHLRAIERERTHREVLAGPDLDFDLFFVKALLSAPES